MPEEVEENYYWIKASSALEDGSFSWIPLKDLKESNLIQVVEHVKTRTIDSNTVFSLRTICTLREIDAIEDAVVIRAKNTLHEHGMHAH